jgi:hypothetical protein
MVVFGEAGRVDDEAPQSPCFLAATAGAGAAALGLAGAGLTGAGLVGAAAVAWVRGWYFGQCL